MRVVWLLLLVVVLFALGRSWNGSTSPAFPARSGATAESHAGGPVRQLQRQPSEVMDMKAAMPQTGGVSTHSMLDTARAAGR